ncbi:MAG: hypothetical protein JNK05_09395 [Myxococcales bacterium]|nr:hypothetical protein [Myxococcales bacterium]
MAAFSPDGAHFVFQDGFALTRLTLPKSLKSDRALAGTRIHAAGNIVVARRRYDRVLSVNLDNLEKRPWALGEYGDWVPHPDGVHAINVGNGAVPLTDCSTGVDAPLECPEAAPFVGALELGDGWPQNQYRRNVAEMSADAVALVYVANLPDNPPHGGLLYCVDLADPSAPVFRWRAHGQCGVGQLSLAPGREVSYVHTFDRGLGRALIHRIDASSEAPTVESRTLRSLEAPTCFGDQWAWIDDDGFVCVAPWADFSRAERLPLPAGVDAYGTLAMHRERVLFVPRDGERVVDVREKRVIPRKLPAAEAPMRSRVAQIAERFDRWLAKDGGSLVFSHVERKKSSSWIDWSPSWDLGRASLSSHLAVGEMLGELQENSEGLERVSVGSYSGTSGFRQQTPDDVRQAFSAMDRHRGKLVRACRLLEYGLARWFEPAYADRKSRGLPAPPKAFTDDASTVLLRAVFEQCQSNDRIALADNVDRWLGERWTPETLAAQVYPQDPHSHPQVREPGVAHVLAYVALDLLGKDSLPVLARWIVEEPTFFARYNPHIIGDVAARMIQYYPETEQAFTAICEAHGSHGANVLLTMRQRLS